MRHARSARQNRLDGSSGYAAASPAARVILDGSGERAQLDVQENAERETILALRLHDERRAGGNAARIARASTLTFGVVSLRGRLQHLLRRRRRAAARARESSRLRSRASRPRDAEHWARGARPRRPHAARAAHHRRAPPRWPRRRGAAQPAPLVDGCGPPAAAAGRGGGARRDVQRAGPLYDAPRQRCADGASARRRAPPARRACAADGALSPWAVAVRGGRADWPPAACGHCRMAGRLLRGARRGLAIRRARDRGGARRRVLDLCAGNGGKSVALAGMVGDAGHVFAYDVEVKRLEQLRAAAVRAGVDDRARRRSAPPPRSRRTRPTMSSSSTRRVRGAQFGATRACDGRGRRARAGLDEVGRWRAAAAADFPTLQRSLCAQALSLARPDGGRVVYATCSLEREQNDDVADAVEAAGGMRPWEFATPPAGAVGAAAHRVTLWPHRHGCDGFFVARWRRG